MKKKLILLFSALALYCQAQEKEFPIGIWSPPNVKIALTPCSADYNGDGQVDLAVKTDGGYWLIDYGDKTKANNGFSHLQDEWELTLSQRGDATAHPVPADYNGDGLADIAVKTDDGRWLIDFSDNNPDTTNHGFSKWDLEVFDRGDATAHPVPADYNGDGYADMAVKIDDGRWLIDYAELKNGKVVFEGWQTWLYNKGNATYHPCPADYNGDGLVDLAVKTDSGEWYIDYAANQPNNNYGFQDGWGAPAKIGLGGASSRPVPGYYNEDNIADIAIKTDSGNWKIDFAERINNEIVFNGWNDDDRYKGYGGSEADPIPADYDGDGKFDLSIFVNSDFRWLIDPSTDLIDGYKYFCNLGSYTKHEHLGINTEDRLAFKKIRDANIDFLIGANVMDATPDVRNNFSKIDYYLKIASLESLGVMVSSHNILSFNKLNEDIREEHRDLIKHLRNDISPDLKNTISGIFLGDEPRPINDPKRPNDFANVIEWTEFFKREYSEKHTYYNLLPSYYSYFLNNNEFEQYLNSYINTNTPSNFSVDHYPFKEGEEYKTSFFYNLSELKKKSGEKDFWFVIQSNNDGYAPDPYEPKLKFLTSSAIAYGAKGISYWSYLDNGFAEYPLQHSSIKKVNNYLKKLVGPIVVNNKNIATLHKSNTVLNTNYPFPTTELILNNKTVLRDVNNDNILIGVFESEKVDNLKTDYLWIVNKDFNFPVKSVKIYLKGYCVGNTYLSQRVDDYNATLDSFSPVTNAYFDYLNNQTIVTIPELKAGEGIMLKVMMKRFIKYKDYDGDGKADRSIKTNLGEWKIDLKIDGFNNNWQEIYYQYGDATAHACPADYDGNGLTDLSVKTDDGRWLIDYAKNTSGNRFTGWDTPTDQYNLYGDATAHPAPADYNGDGLADIAVKTDDGRWLIDYADKNPNAINNGFTGWNTPIDEYGLYGDANAHPVPADYDGDGKADISVKTDDGKWLIDYANNGFNGWDTPIDEYVYGDLTAHPVPADYDGDGLADLSVKTDDKRWLIDYAANGFRGWDLILNDERGDSTAHPFPADYNGLGMADLSVKTDDGRWLIDYAEDGYNGWQEFLYNNGNAGSIALKQNKDAAVKTDLFENIPNPFTSSTIIKFSFKTKPKKIEIVINNSTGQLVDKFSLSDKEINDGYFTYEPLSLQTGVFYYSLVCDGKIVETNKMIKQ